MDGNSGKKYKKRTERETMREMERQVKEGEALATRTADFPLKRAAVISEGLHRLGEWNEGSRLFQVLQLSL